MNNEGKVWAIKTSATLAAMKDGLEPGSFAVLEVEAPEIEGGIGYMYRPSKPAKVPKCIIKGHDHDLIHVRRTFQKGTGRVLDIWECKDKYRFICIDGQEPNRIMMGKRPRWGWSK